MICFAVCSAIGGGTTPTKRTTCARTLTAAAAAIVLGTSVLQAHPVHALISQEPCVAGEGPGCAAADDIPIIRQLQERSRANKQKNEEAALERYWKEGYGGYFKFSIGKDLVKDPETGEWSLQKPDSGVAKAIRRAGVLPEFDPY